MDFFGKLLHQPSAHLSWDQVRDLKQVERFVQFFLEQDEQMQVFLNHHTYLMFIRGFRPCCQVGKNPEDHLAALHQLETWIIHKLYLDLNSLKRKTENDFEAFLDQLDRQAYASYYQMGKIAIDYGLDPGDYDCYRAINQKLLSLEAKHDFIKHQLTYNILSAQYRFMVWLYYQYYGIWYYVKT